MINNIQLLRAAAAYMVALHHIQSKYGGNDLGALGVDIFFVISGFIMVFTNYSRPRSPTDFWRDRALRIVPLYWLATFTLIFFSSIGFRPVGLHDWDASDLFTSLFFIPDIRADGAAVPILHVGWTLVYEMFFYLLFGTVLLLHNIRASVLALCLIMTLLCAVGWIFEPSSIIARYYLSPLLLEFTAGCVLGLLYRNADLLSSTRPWRWALPMLATSISIAVAADYSLGESLAAVETGKTERLLFSGSAALLIVTAALILEKSGRRFAGHFLLLQGAASYAIYLFHPLIIHLVYKVPIFLGADIGPWLAGLCGLVAILAIGLFGTIVHLHIELPATRWLKHLMEKRTLGESNRIV